LNSKHHEENFSNLEKIIVTVSRISAVCRVILLYEAREINSLLGNCHLYRDWIEVPDLGEDLRDSLPGPRIPRPLSS